MRALLDAGSDTSVQDNDQATALFRSVNKGFYEIARELLERGAAVNARSSNVLQEAIGKGEVELVELMLEKGASVNTQGYHSPTSSFSCTLLLILGNQEPIRQSPPSRRLYHPSLRPPSEPPPRKEN